jgi:flagellar protein FlaF
MDTLTELAQNAYGVSRSQTIATPRDVEFHAFAYVTGLMVDARDGGVFARVAEAMHQNVRLWAALAADCGSPGNKLPPELRNNIIDLANFARVHMAAVIDGKDTIDALIDVNLAVMKGLKGEEGGAS